jgi:competence protein ComEC
VPLAGGGPSIQRAGVMGAAAVVAVLAGRPAARWHALLLATAVTLSLNPRAIEDVGWQLSFAAVVAILVLAGRVRDGLVRRGLPRGLAEGRRHRRRDVGTAPPLRRREASLVRSRQRARAPAVAPAMAGDARGRAGQVGTAGRARGLADSVAYDVGRARRQRLPAHERLVWLVGVACVAGRSRSVALGAASDRPRRRRLALGTVPSRTQAAGLPAPLG